MRPLFAVEKPETTLTILFTNDLHGHMDAWRGWDGALYGKTIGGMDRIAAVAKRVRRERGAENVLLLDAGDAWSDTMIASETKGRAIIEVMNLIGYDAMTIGNHEPDFGPDELRARIQQAKFPIIAANITTPNAGLLVRPYIIRECYGAKIGFLGLAYPNTPLTTAKKNVQGLQFGDAAEAAQKFVPELRQAGAQIVIALTHLGLSADIKLAESVEGIDLVIGGHSHNRMTEPLRVGRTAIMQAGAHGSDVGRLDLQIRDGELSDVTGELILLDNDAVASDSGVAQKIQELKGPFRKLLDEVIAHATEPIIRAQTIAGSKPRRRDEESPADSLFADILREQTGSDIALLPGVGYGVAIPAGPISAAALRNLVPHESKFVTVGLTGAQVREILEQSIENTFADDVHRKVGGMIQVSGLTFRYVAHAAFGHRVLEVKVGESPLAENQRYRVATNSMLSAGGHNYKTFLEATDRQEHEAQYETLRDALRKRHSIAPARPGRMFKQMKCTLE